MDHSVFMKRALELAQAGWPEAIPNPLVGCVIVKDGRIVAEGAHLAYGGPHAEVNAVKALGDVTDPKAHTVYVTLEPCAHFGKTPPCADLLIDKGFAEVVVAAEDPNPLVSGKGIERLRAAGIRVITGVCRETAREMNRRFFTFHEKKRPYIVLKWAQSQDGFVSRYPVPTLRSENMISRGPAQLVSHQLRARSQAILVGKTTVMADDPALTVRLVKGRHPLRVVLDRRLEIPPTMAVFSKEAPVWLVNEQKSGVEGHVNYIKIEEGPMFLQQVLSALHQNGIQNLLVEGGTQILQGFIDQGLWDEVIVIENPDLRLGSGVEAPKFAIKNTFGLVGEDKLFQHFKDEGMAEKGPLTYEIF